MISISKKILIVGALTLGASGLFASPAGNNWTNTLYRAKQGRNDPMVEAQKAAERANSAYRAAPAHIVKINYLQQEFREKLGRAVYPTDEARQRKAQANSAYRQEPQEKVQQSPQQYEKNYLREKRGITSNR